MTCSASSWRDTRDHSLLLTAFWTLSEPALLIHDYRRQVFIAHVPYVSKLLVYRPLSSLGRSLFPRPAVAELDKLCRSVYASSSVRQSDRRLFLASLAGDIGVPLGIEHFNERRDDSVGVGICAGLQLLSCTQLSTSLFDVSRDRPRG